MAQRLGGGSVGGTRAEWSPLLLQWLSRESAAFWLVAMATKLMENTIYWKMTCCVRRSGSPWCLGSHEWTSHSKDPLRADLLTGRTTPIKPWSGTLQLLLLVQLRRWILRLTLETQPVIYMPLLLYYYHICFWVKYAILKNHNWNCLSVLTLLSFLTWFWLLMCSFDVFSGRLQRKDVYFMSWVQTF